MSRTDNLAPVELEVVEYHGVQTEDGWEHHSYTVRLSRGDESMKTPWKAGLALDEPTAADVLESLILDAQGFTPEAFEDWADEYGYDTDSRKAYALSEQIGKLSDDLRDVLGAEDFEAAMSGDAEEEAARLTVDE